jgi:hypothetical protein
MRTIKLIGVAGIVAICGCGDVFRNLTASLGGNVGQRGDLLVLFINNTDFQPVFTHGTYDQTDADFEPDASQFNIVDATIEPGESTEIGSLECGRIFSIGSPRLLDLIEQNLADVEADPAALIEGVAFYDEDATEPNEVDLVGTAPAFEALLGVDFPCESLLIIRFEPGDAADKFRVDFELIASESTR